MHWSPLGGRSRIDIQWPEPRLNQTPIEIVYPRLRSTASDGYAAGREDVLRRRQSRSACRRRQPHSPIRGTDVEKADAMLARQFQHVPVGPFCLGPRKRAIDYDPADAVIGDLGAIDIITCQGAIHRRV